MKIIAFIVAIFFIRSNVQASTLRDIKYNNFLNFDKYNIKYKPEKFEETNVLVVLVQFTDTDIEYSSTDWYNSIFPLKGVSVNNYFNEVSENDFKVNPVKETSYEENDGIIKVTLPYEHPNFLQYEYKEEVFFYRKSVKDALLLADEYIDFSTYDFNEDGILTYDEFNLITVFAGDDYSVTPVVEKSTYASVEKLIDNDTKEFLQLDGVQFNKTVLLGEKHHNNKATIGVIIHELSHLFELPDLYDTFNIAGNDKGVDTDSVMSKGMHGIGESGIRGTSPSYYDPWSMIKLGFRQYETVKPTIEPVSFKLSKKDIIKIETDDEKKYYLVENRRYEGYDKSANKSSGILIWYINENYDRNFNKYSRLVNLEQRFSEKGVFESKYNNLYIEVLDKSKSKMDIVIYKK